MTLTPEYIKKLMGWCPNAKITEARQHIILEDFCSDISDRAKGENGDLKNLGWLQKASTRILLLDIFLTFVYFPILYHTGLNPMVFLLVGFFVIIRNLLYWNDQMQRYDNLVKQPVTEYSKKRRIIAYVISFVLPFVALFLVIIVGLEHALKTMFSFGGGFLVGMWLIYFQLIYWEKKNHKTIYINKRDGMWKTSYIIRERK